MTTGPATPAPAAAPAPAPAPAAAPPAPPAEKPLDEKERKEKLLQERLDKRSAGVLPILTKFLAAHEAGARAEMQVRLEAMMKKGKKGKKKKKKKVEEKPAKGGKAAKPKLKPTSEAWMTLIRDIDERITKLKRCSLDDLYRAVGRLDDKQKQDLNAIIAGTKPKVFPKNDMKEPFLNIKNTIFAAASAFNYPVEKVSLYATGCGTAALMAKGASAPQLLDLGFRERELLRAGYPKEDVIHASYDFTQLRAAGYSASDVIANSPVDLSGYRGATRLRSAGYLASQVRTGGIDSPWDLQQAGYSLSELVDAGYSGAELRAAGFGGADAGAVNARRTTFRKIQWSDPRNMAPWLEGTQDPKWQVALGNVDDARALKSATTLIRPHTAGPKSRLHSATPLSGTPMPAQPLSSSGGVAASGAGGTARTAWVE